MAERKSLVTIRSVVTLVLIVLAMVAFVWVVETYDLSSGHWKPGTLKEEPDR